MIMGELRRITPTLVIFGCEDTSQINQLYFPRFLASLMTILLLLLLLQLSVLDFCLHALHSCMLLSCDFPVRLRCGDYRWELVVHPLEGWLIYGLPLSGTLLLARYTDASTAITYIFHMAVQDSRWYCTFAICYNKLNLQVSNLKNKFSYTVVFFYYIIYSFIFLKFAKEMYIEKKFATERKLINIFISFNKNIPIKEKKQKKQILVVI